MTTRQEFTAKTKLAAWNRCGGFCEKCGAKLGVGGNSPEYDHITECWETGDNHPDNCQVLGSKCCHPPKTARKAAERAKADRLAKRQAGIKPKSRPMPGTKASGLKKKMNGEVVRR